MKAWVICPMVKTTIQVNGKDREVRAPKFVTLVDQGRPAKSSRDDDGNPVSLPARYRFSIVDGGQDWCLAYVVGKDFSALDADAEIVKVFEGDNIPLNSTPNGLGWDQAKVDRVNARLAAKGADLSGLNADEPLWKCLRQLGRVLDGDFLGPRGTWAQDPEDDV